MRKTWWRAGQFVLGALIVGFAARQVVRNWDDVRRTPLHWEPRPLLLLASVLLVWCMYALLVGAWRYLLTSWQQRLDGWTAARIWTVSSLGKYLPGKVWAIAGMALMAQRAGVAPWAAVGSAVILQALAIGTGVAVAAALAWPELAARYPHAGPLMAGLVVASAVGIGLLLNAAFVRRLLKFAGVSAGENPVPSGRAVFVGVVTNLVAWCGYGVALWVLCRGLLPDAPLPVSTAIAAFAASYIAGFLALIAPGGVGVREGVLILLLQAPLGYSTALALALASRILLTITEFGAAVPFLIRPGENVRVAT